MRISFFPENFLDGTKSFTDAQVGMYIRLLCIQAEYIFITPSVFTKICPNDSQIRTKFKIEPNGNLYNVRMRKEMIDAARMEARDKQLKIQLHLFTESELYGKQIFKACFPSWSKDKLLHYYERAKEWSLNRDGKSKDWSLTIGSWARIDEQKGSVKFKSIRL